MTLAEVSMLASLCAASIHPTTLSAVVAQESGGNIYAIGVNGAEQLPRQPRTLEEAIVTSKTLQQKGIHFDIGLGQINSRNLGWLGLSLREAFEPCKNLQGTQTILTNCYKRALPQYREEQIALRAALSCYNTGNFRSGFTNGYVQKVASKAGITVPALLPTMEGSFEKPVKLRAVPKGNTMAQSAEPSTPREGLPDAFSDKRTSVRDLFSSQGGRNVTPYASPPAQGGNGNTRNLESQ